MVGSLPAPPPLLLGVGPLLRFVLHRKQQRPVRDYVLVPVVNRLDKMTKDNLLEAARISRSAKRNTR